MSLKRCAFFLLSCFCLSLLRVPPVRADGGPYVESRKIWEQLEESSQTAIIKLNTDETVQTDLFVTIQDRSGERHELVFFVPLGVQARDIDVKEVRALDFFPAYTFALDERFDNDLRQHQDYRDQALGGYWLGTLLLNGGPGPFVFAMPSLLALLSRLGGSEPEMLFKTGSGNVAVYDLHERTDIEALIQATGLPEGVQDTLESLRGQRLAVVTIVTNVEPITSSEPASPRNRAEVSASADPAETNGLLLSWTTSMLPSESPDADGRLVHHYPLGTGKAWANPIPLTQVYVIAAPGIGFEVQSPAIGEDYSGFETLLEGGSIGERTGWQWRIYQVPAGVTAYAFDQIITSAGQLWRGTYTYANPSEDIAIVLHEPPAQRPYYAYYNWRFHFWWMGATLALVAWLLVWRYLVGRFVGIRYTWSSANLWNDSLYWLIKGPLTATAILPFLAFAFGIGVFYTSKGHTVCLTYVVPFGLLAHILTAVHFARRGPGSQPPSPLGGATIDAQPLDDRRRKKDPPRPFRVRAFWGYLVVVLASNSIYLALSLIAGISMGAL